MIRKTFGWNLQENSRKLLAVIDKTTMSKLISYEMLSTNDKKYDVLFSNIQKTAMKYMTASSWDMDYVTPFA